MKIKVIITLVLLLSGVMMGVYGYYHYGKILPYLGQLTKVYVPLNADVQSVSQKEAHYVGSKACQSCHQTLYNQWHDSQHAKMIQDVRKNPAAMIADWSVLPQGADFKKEEIVYTIGGKFKQRYMIAKELNGTQDYVIGNYQWNTQTSSWLPYASYKDWYAPVLAHDNTQVGTSKTCDGCHFTGFMSQEVRTEPSTSCESCHGPGSEHAKEPQNPIYNPMHYDPKHATQTCLQCHMRNRDKRMETMTLQAIGSDVRDYPKGYEPGRPLPEYKNKAPFEGKETGEFYANGVAKKNRTQGNEYVTSMMYRHGITCVNCHDPHAQNNAATQGDAICMKCHAAGSPIGPHQETIQAHTHHKTSSKGSSCIECHMPKTGKHLGQSPLTVRTHVFGFITPLESKKYGVPNACTNCHTDETLDWAHEALQKWGMNSWLN